MVLWHHVGCCSRLHHCWRWVCDLADTADRKPDAGALEGPGIETAERDKLSAGTETPKDDVVPATSDHWKGGNSYQLGGYVYMHILIEIWYHTSGRVWWNRDQSELELIFLCNKNRISKYTWRTGNWCIGKKNVFHQFITLVNVWNTHNSRWSETLLIWKKKPSLSKGHLHNEY